MVKIKNILVAFFLASLGCPGTILGDPGDESHFVVGPQSLNFGETLPGEFVSLSFAITNTGISILSITDINSSNSAFLVSDTVFTVAPFNSHTVSVSFQPQRSGPFDGELTIFQNNSLDYTTQLELIGWTPIELNSDKDVFNFGHNFQLYYYGQRIARHSVVYQRRHRRNRDAEPFLAKAKLYSNTHCETFF